MTPGIKRVERDEAINNERKRYDYEQYYDGSYFPVLCIIEMKNVPENYTKIDAGYFKQKL